MSRKYMLVFFYNIKQETSDSVDQVFLTGPLTFINPKTN